MSPTHHDDHHRLDGAPGTVRSPSTGLLEDFSSALFQSVAPAGRPAPAEGLRMAPEFLHEPVLLAEVLDLFEPVPAGVIVDGTVGAGGHAAALLDTRNDLGLLGFDRDPAALAAAGARLAPFGSRSVLRHARFGGLGQEVADARSAGDWPQLASADPAAGLSGVLLDLGVSSPQLDRADRGFSYRHDAPLDMRMDPSAGLSAAELLEVMSEAELTALLVENGEGRLARRIARAVMAARPLSTTGQLAEVVARSVPAPARRRGHPARRVFQALRIAVNDELGELAAALPAALELVAVGGRVAVIAYHSGEDRLVKAAFAEAATGGCVCPPGLPCVCGAVVEHRLVFRGARRPGPAEVAANRRAESARLRALQRIEPRPLAEDRR